MLHSAVIESIKAGEHKGNLPVFEQLKARPIIEEIDDLKTKLSETTNKYHHVLEQMSILKESNRIINGLDVKKEVKLQFLNQKRQ